MTIVLRGSLTVRGGRTGWQLRCQEEGCPFPRTKFPIYPTRAQAERAAGEHVLRCHTPKYEVKWADGLPT